MKNKIEEIFQQLVALPLWGIGRAGSLEWFAFGVERREILLRDGKTKIVSEYALHVQCPWRIRYQSKLIVASDDRFYPAGDDPHKDLPDFDWDQQGANQLDQGVSRFLAEHGASPLVVEAVNAKEHGDITISLNSEYFLEIFINNSIADEHWRFFKPYSKEEHFVFTSKGIQQE
jgi:hypothetical protein